MSMQPHLYAVALHAYEEAGGQLRAGGASIEERGGGMREPSLAQQMVRLNGTLYVTLMHAH